MKIAHFILAATVAIAAAPALLADPFAEIPGFSSLKIDQARLEKGDIISARTPGVTHPRGQAIESVFVVEAPFEKTVGALRSWNGSGHSELKVYLHGDLPGSPGPADFQKLAGAPGNSAVKALAAATAKGDAQLSPAEAGQAPKDAEGRGLSPALVQFWSAVLAKRAQAYAGGGLPSQPPFGTGEQKVSPAAEAASLLRSIPKISAHFRPALNAAGLNGTPSRSSLYWELVSAEGTAALTLGSAAGSSPGKGTAQEADIGYYASGNFYVFLTMQQAWPVTIGGKPSTLVYRCDATSAAELGKLRGIERNAAGSAMSKEIARIIGHFQKDTAR
jgi:hypothetical protein